MQLTLDLTLSEFDTLEALAERELRTPEAQALYMLRQELKCRSLDVPEEAEDDTPVASSGEFFTVKVHDEAGNKKTFRIPRGEVDEDGWYSIELPPEAFTDGDSVIVEDVDDVLKWQNARIGDKTDFNESWLDDLYKDTYASTSGHLFYAGKFNTTGKSYGDFLAKISFDKAYDTSWPSQPATPHVHDTGKVESQAA